MDQMHLSVDSKMPVLPNTILMVTEHAGTPPPPRGEEGASLWSECPGRQDCEQMQP